jgi:hypothetical protein
MTPFKEKMTQLKDKAQTMNDIKADSILRFAWDELGRRPYPVNGALMFHMERLHMAITGVRIPKFLNASPRRRYRQ